MYKKMYSWLTALMKKSPWSVDTTPKFVYWKTASMIQFSRWSKLFLAQKAYMRRGTSLVDWWLTRTSVSSLIIFSIISPDSTTIPTQIQLCISSFCQFIISMLGNPSELEVTHCNILQSNSSKRPSWEAIGKIALRSSNTNQVSKSKPGEEWYTTRHTWEYSTGYWLKPPGTVEPRGWCART